MAKATPIRGLSAHALLREVGPRILTARLRDLERHHAGLPAEDPVHDMRVAARRLRAALRLLRLRELDPAVKSLQDALGRVRDLQLQAAWLRGRDDALARGRAALLVEAERGLASARSTWRELSLPRLLQAAADASKLRGKLGGKRVRRLLCKRLRRFEERLDAALLRPSAPAIHRARISVKQLRYLFELLPFAGKRLLVELLPLQESLGEMHDLDVRIRLLQPHAPALLREQNEDRLRLARIVVAQLSRWKKRRISPRARSRLRD